MKQLFLMVEDGSVQLLDTPAPTVKDNTVIVETLYSVVSAGTERSLTSFGGKNLVQKAMERPDQLKKVTEKMSTDGILTTVEAAFNKLGEPMPMGYSAVGRIRECGRGVTGVQAGDIVAMAGQAYHSEVNRVNRNLIAKLPSGIKDIRQAAFGALAGIALEGIHQAEIIPGETVAVVGMGLLGHIVSRILYAYGCDVIGFDIADKDIPETRLKAFVRSDEDQAADIAKSLTGGRGVDKVIITAAADSNAPMDLAAAITRDRGIICMIGVTQMNIDRRPYYERELTFKIARSYGPGRYDPSYEEAGVDYPIGFVRFTEGRNLEEFIRLLAGGRLSLEDLITHIIPFGLAADAYEMITTNKKHARYIGILLEYSQKNAEKWNPVIYTDKQKVPKKVYHDKSNISLGLIGAGNFARSTMLPAMKLNGRYRFTGLATTGGIGAAQANIGVNFEYTTNDYRKLIQDKNIDLIVVSTQHSSHAKFILEALRAGKHVYCEKPLCLTLDELNSIVEAYHTSGRELFCGMNRRHAPLVQDIKKKLHTDKVPAIYDYIVNAGYIPAKHWVQDEKTGGGRILGEACHFIDTIQYLDGSDLINLQVTFASNKGYPMKDNAVILMKFSSGAVGVVHYTSMGSKKYPKEQLRVFSNGSVCELDNYVKLTHYDSRKEGVFRLKQDKGIAGEYEYIIDVISGKRKNDAIEEAFTACRMLIEALEN